MNDVSLLSTLQETSMQLLRSIIEGSDDEQSKALEGGAGEALLDVFCSRYVSTLFLWKTLSNDIQIFEGRDPRAGRYMRCQVYDCSAGFDEASTHQPRGAQKNQSTPK
jgi:hypothetical protein